MSTHISAWLLALLWLPGQIKHFVFTLRAFLSAYLQFYHSVPHLIQTDCLQLDAVSTIFIYTSGLSVNIVRSFPEMASQPNDKLFISICCFFRELKPGITLYAYSLYLINMMLIFCNQHYLRCNLHTKHPHVKCTGW